MKETQDTENTYRNITNLNDFNSKQNSSFGKSVLIPFISGALGCSLILGTCFGIPSVKERLIGNSPSTNNSSSSLLNNLQNANTSTNSNYVSLKDFSDTSVYAANKISPSIVGIEITYTVSSIFSKYEQTASASGSGIIISEDGYILTNNHVVSTSNSSLSSYYQISDATSVHVYLHDDETPYEAKIVGTDPQTDLAIVKVDLTGLTAAEFGNSDNLKIGEFAMAIGNPLGLKSTITSGIVSALNREVTDENGKTFVLIQTDAAINSGNSGGALVNSQGQVIGINTLKLSGSDIEGIGFAIPINSAIDIISDLITYNKVIRPYIGIGGIDLTEELAKQNNLVVGIYVKTVDDFSAAEKAGIKPGDVVISINGTSVKTMDELNKIKNTHSVGDEITLTIDRNGTEKQLTLTLQEAP